MMKKKLNYIILFASLFTFMLVNVKATSSISCTPKSVNVGDQITCKITTDEAVEVSSKLSIVAGNSTLDTDGNIVYKATSKGTYDVTLKTVNPGFTDKDTIVVNEKTTTTKTTTTTTKTTKTKSDNNFLKSIKIDKEEIYDFSKNTTKYFIDVENDVTKVNITAEAEDENATVKIDGPKTLEIGENEYTISVTSESDSTKNYKIIVTRKDEEESSNTGIKSIKIRGYHLKFDKNSKTFHLKINKEDTELDITVKLKDKNASYEIDGNDNLTDGSNIKIIVTAEDGNTDTYRIIIEKEEKNIIPLIVGSISFLIILIIVIVIIIKKKRNKNKKNSNDKEKKVVAKPHKENVSTDEEKTIEMPIIKDNNYDSYDDYEENNYDDYENDNYEVDNDEEEETRILSYAEQKELDRQRRKNEEMNRALDEAFDNDYEDEF